MDESYEAMQEGEVYTRRLQSVFLYLAGPLFESFSIDGCIINICTGSPRLDTRMCQATSSL